MGWFDWFKKTPANTVKRARNGSRRDFTAASEYQLLKDWATYDSGTINALLMSAGEKLRTRARFACRNTDIAKRFVELAKRNTIGYMMRYKLQADWRKDKILEQALEIHTDLLNEQSKAENFTAQGNLTRGETENLILEHIIRDGEALVMRIRNFKRNKTGYTLRVLDPSLIATHLTSGRASAPFNGQEVGERIVAGIGVDSDYKPIAYYMNGTGRADTNAQILTNAGKIVRIPAKDILHLYRQEYANQVRGISWFAPVLVRIEMLRRYEETAVTAARQGAAKHMTLESSRGASYLGDGKDDENSAPEVSMSGDELTVLATGEKLIFNDSVYPHQMYESFMGTNRAGIATGMDTAAVNLTNDWGEINFSAGQLMSLEERQKWEALQKWVSDRFCAWWHDDWLVWVMLKAKFRSAAGRLIPTAVVMKLKQCMWEGKRFAPIDPAKAALAQKTRLANGVTSVTQEILDMGNDPDQVFTERIYEKVNGLGPEPEKGDIMPPNPDTGADDEKDDEPEK